MKIKKSAQAGSLESCDVMVRIEPSQKERKIIIESDVIEQFEEQIQKVVESVLDKYDIDTILIKIQDKGALDFVITSRVETALKRSSKCIKEGGGK